MPESLSACPLVRLSVREDENVSADQRVLREITRQPEDDPWVRLPALREATRLSDPDLRDVLERLMTSGAVRREWRVGVRGGAYRATRL